MTIPIPNLPPITIADLQKDYDAALQFYGSNPLLTLTALDILRIQWCSWNRVVPTGVSWTVNLSPYEQGVVDFFKQKFNPKVIEAHMEDQAFVRTLLVINVVRELKLTTSPKRWRGFLYSNYSFFVMSRERKTHVIIKTHQIYKRKNRKSVHAGLDLNEEKPLALTIMPFSKAAKDELNYPTQLQTQRCPDLVPPFYAIERMEKRKGGVKIVALGPLYKANAKEVSMILDRALQALLAAARGEAYLQERSYSHSDIKPENIFMTEEGRFQLGDYGFLCPLGTASGAGTFGFSAPEVYKRVSKTTASSLWEIGVTGLELMKCPIREELLKFGYNYSLLPQEHADQIVTLIRQDLINRAKRNVRLPIWIELFDLCASCLRVNPDERPSLSILIKGLESLQNLNTKGKREPSDDEVAFKRAATLLVKAAEEIV